MTRIILLIAVVWGLILTAEPALAACTTQAVYVDGQLRYCMTCCYGAAGCTTTCT